MVCLEVFLNKLKENDIHALDLAPQEVRFVTHLDITDAMIEKNIQNRLITISTYEKSDSLFIEFEDNAGGIKDTVIGKIFDPYFSTKNNKNGTGLGLYMSKTIIEEHSGGKINVYNTDFGTKFVIKLPLK